MLTFLISQKAMHSSVKDNFVLIDPDQHLFSEEEGVSLGDISLLGALHQPSAFDMLAIARAFELSERTPAVKFALFDPHFERNCQPDSVAKIGELLRDMFPCCEFRFIK